MKKLLCLALLSLCVAAARADGSTNPETSNYAVAERGADHRVWNRVILETNSIGTVRARTNSYTELETGMHY